MVVGEGLYYFLVGLKASSYSKGEMGTTIKLGPNSLLLCNSAPSKYISSPCLALHDNFLALLLLQTLDPIL